MHFEHGKKNAKGQWGCWLVIPHETVWFVSARRSDGHESVRHYFYVFRPFKHVLWEKKTTKIKFTYNNRPRLPYLRSLDRELDFLCGTGNPCRHFGRIKKVTRLRGCRCFEIRIHPFVTHRNDNVCFPFFFPLRLMMPARIKIQICLQSTVRAFNVYTLAAQQRFFKCYLEIFRFFPIR